MIKTYFKIAWHNLVHNKAFSAINILGMGCSLLTNTLTYSATLSDGNALPAWLKSDAKKKHFQVRQKKLKLII